MSEPGQYCRRQQHRHFMARVGFALLVMLSTPVSAAESAPENDASNDNGTLEIGIHPYLSVRTLATSKEVPHIMFLAHPKTPRREVADMTRLLLEFAENTPEGKKFINDTGYLGLRPPTAGEMKSLDPYVGDLKTLLGPAR